ncbi:hypothetical protein [Arachidicoccus sp.]|uniref:hypothetical protein n=1 Tax=Arachidicoccus sp. TaxID=1872624 RepID=UPI003D1FC37C
MIEKNQKVKAVNGIAKKYCVSLKELKRASLERKFFFNVQQNIFLNAFHLRPEGATYLVKMVQLELRRDQEWKLEEHSFILTKSLLKI